MSDTQVTLELAEHEAEALLRSVDRSRQLLRAGMSFREDVRALKGVSDELRRQGVRNMAVRS